MSTDLVQELVRTFGLDPQDRWQLNRLGSGHIHHTFRLQSGKENLIIQRVNTDVFKDTLKLKQNLKVLIRHCRLYRHEFEAAGMTFLETAGGDWHSDGNYLWRAFKEVENSYTLELPRSQKDAFEGARGFGVFLRVMEKLDPSSIGETIPHFHDGRVRWSQYEKAYLTAAPTRKEQAAEVIQLLEPFKQLLGLVPELLNEGVLPLRIAHNDTKINNILFDNANGNALCVIDLDTVMPGTWLYDFGDMARTFTPYSAEDEPASQNVKISTEFLFALSDGFMDALGPIISKAEIDYLPLAGPYMCALIGIRFLTDYLLGDHYFPVNYAEHNLVRARNQLLVAHQLMQQQEPLQNYIQQKFSSIKL
jgi:thiamine kinase-like enzyme